MGSRLDRLLTKSSLRLNLVRQSGLYTDGSNRLVSSLWVICIVWVSIECESSVTVISHSHQAQISHLLSYSMSHQIMSHLHEQCAGMSRKPWVISLKSWVRNNGGWCDDVYNGYFLPKDAIILGNTWYISLPPSRRWQSNTWTNNKYLTPLFLPSGQSCMMTFSFRSLHIQAKTHHRIQCRLMCACCHGVCLQLWAASLPWAVGWPMTPAVSSGSHVVDGYVRVGPNQWSRRSDIIGDVAWCRLT